MKEAIERMSADIIVFFLDADIRNLTTDWANQLVAAIIDDNCDMSRGFYTRHARDSPVTKLIARPMLHIFFPELSHFEHPLSGEVCARAQVWKEILSKESIPEGRIDVWFFD